MRRILPVILLSFIFLTSCTKEEKNLPTASFDFTLSQSQAPATVILTNKSTNALNYKWETSDGKTSTETNPKFTFSDGGTYEITLTAFNNDGSTSYSKSVVVENRPVPTKVRILSLDFTNWGQSGWDLTGGPDVYYKIWSGNTLILDGKEFTVNDVYFNTWPNCIWYFQPEIELQANSQIKLELYDYDEEDSDDLMRTIDYNFADYSTYPSRLINTENLIKVELEITWVY